MMQSGLKKCKKVELEISRSFPKNFVKNRFHGKIHISKYEIEFFSVKSHFDSPCDDDEFAAAVVAVAEVGKLEMLPPP